MFIPTRSSSYKRIKGSFSPWNTVRSRWGWDSAGTVTLRSRSLCWCLAVSLWPVLWQQTRSPLHSVCGCYKTGLASSHFECIMLCCYLFFSKLNKLEQLEELNLSGNKLKTIPTTIANCRRLHTLVAHSNNISIFPEILQLPQIQVLLCDGMVSCWRNGRVFSSHKGEASGSLGSQ